MDNPRFVDEGDIPLFDDDYDDYNTPNTSRMDGTSFTVPDTTEATSTLRLRQKVKRDKSTTLYRQLNVTGDPGLADTGEFLAAKIQREKFGGLNIMKSVLSLDESPFALERSFKVAAKLKGELPTDLEMESIPLKELSSLVEDIHVKTRETSQNTDLDMREFLGIEKTLQSIRGELLNNTSKLTEIFNRIQKDTKKLEEVGNDPTYTDKQRQLYRDRLDNPNIEK